MKKILSFFKTQRMVPVILTLVLSIFFTVTVAEAATTISTNISTGGTLTVTGLSALGAVTATTLNGITFNNAGTGTFTLGNLKTFTVNNTLTFSGTDGTTMTFPGTSASIARTDAAQTFTGVQTFTSPVLITPTIGAATGTSLAVTGAVTSSSPSAGIGYATGAGCNVTQLTSRATGVTCTGVSGSITTMATSLAAATRASFTVTDTSVVAGDTIALSVRSGPTADTSVYFVTAVGAGSFNITAANLNASTADTGAAIINFAVIKSVSN